MEFRGASFEEAYFSALYDVSRHYDYFCSPRGSKIKEIICPTMLVTNPRNRLLTNKKRNANYGFAVGEFLWYWKGANDLKTMQYYNKRMKHFSDDGKTLNSAYGQIIKGTGDYFKINQWENVINTLIKDPDSRRAILQIHQPEHGDIANKKGSKDVPCTLSLQIFIRNKNLHMHAHMRSNDIIWGTVYDVFSFTLLQECMLLELKKRAPEIFEDLEMGDYIHTAGSLHLYERHFKLAEEMLSEHAKENYKYEDSKMDRIKSLSTLDDLLYVEQSLREGDRIVCCNNDKFFNWMTDRLTEQRRKRDAEAK